ncbi:ABC-type nitrate/sulfonate/bicarbonate transport system, periplasmic component [Opitutaceae bacterium TAV1]|nr:nitrate ABC transporter substrate-binding protein [Opitutaceae bacterium TAV5]EIQ01678.1 ABC-type nitrate/sulfonate/bicarbonate transport system, periplasmic component [Opitutaceae bacterium TAV1]
MSTATLPTTVTTAPVATQTPVAIDIHYTICPVFVASNVALELGWIEEEVKKAGGKLNYLFTGSDDAHYLPHFSHRHDNLFRDGGNIPSIWAKADNTDTTLVGLTWAPHGGQIVVRAGSGIHRAADLAGRRIALYKSEHAGKVDWWRATSHHGILLALKLAGLTTDDVELVDINDADRPWGGGARPADVWATRPAERRILGSEGVALREGQVDALFTSLGRARSLVETGEFTIIEDLGRHPDWTLQINNSPWALTVNTELAQKHPEIVTGYVRAAVRAGRWINANRAAAAEILHRTNFYPSVASLEQAIRHIDFVPNLSARNLAAITLQKNFLLKYGYIKNDFDVSSWADARFLNEAANSL